MKTQYTIHDVAALLGISADAIRLYEKEGLVEPERNPQNGYRYYGFDQIHKIMGISLYRQLDVGIAEIREILSDQNFEGISERFSGFIDDTQKEIERLQKKIEKLSYMKQHIDSLAMGIGNCQIKDLPERYILYHQDATELLYRKVQKLITSPVFSYGNFCYRLERDEENNYKKKTLEFIVREPMMKLTEWGSDMKCCRHKNNVSVFIWYRRLTFTQKTNGIWIECWIMLRKTILHVSPTPMHFMYTVF